MRQQIHINTPHSIKRKTDRYDWEEKTNKQTKKTIDLLVVIMNEGL